MLCEHVALRMFYTNGLVMLHGFQYVVCVIHSVGTDVLVLIFFVVFVFLHSEKRVSDMRANMTV